MNLRACIPLCPRILFRTMRVMVEVLECTHMDVFQLLPFIMAKYHWGISRLWSVRFSLTGILAVNEQVPALWSTLFSVSYISWDLSFWPSGYANIIAFMIQAALGHFDRRRSRPTRWWPMRRPSLQHGGIRTVGNDPIGRVRGDTVVWKLIQLVTDSVRTLSWSCEKLCKTMPAHLSSARGHSTTCQVGLHMRLWRPNISRTRSMVSK